MAIYESIVYYGGLLCFTYEEPFELFDYNPCVLAIYALSLFQEIAKRRYSNLIEEDRSKIFLLAYACIEEVMTRIPLILPIKWVLKGRRKVSIDE